jgi:hypothetical protein
MSSRKIEKNNVFVIVFVMEGAAPQLDAQAHLNERERAKKDFSLRSK